jgi:murein DD-endopeptidase MepM/ murein hydrolase activator NlpD
MGWVRRKSRVKKAVVPLVLIFSLAAALVLPQTGQANSELDRINRELAKLRQEKAQAEQRARQAENRIQQYERIISQEKQEIRKLLEKIEETTKKMTALEKDIQTKEAEKAEAEEQLRQAIERVEARDKLLQARLRLMYTNGAVTYLDVLLHATSFSDFLDRLNFLKALVGQDKQILEANRRDQQLKEEQTEKIKRLLVQLTANYNAMEKLKNELMAQEKQKEVYIASLNEKIEAEEQITEEEEQLVLSIASKESKLLAQKRKLVTYYQGGKLKYPLPDIYRISSGYGYRIDPITGKKGAFHNGIDFAAPGGTDVLAAESGTVILAGWHGGFGNTVIIDHGNGLWTLYAHMRNNSISVKVNDTVKQGQKIGEVGTTGRSTGNHLHFTVYLNEQSVNPAQYLNLQ